MQLFFLKFVQLFLFFILVITVNYFVCVIFFLCVCVCVPVLAVNWNSLNIVAPREVSRLVWFGFLCTVACCCGSVCRFGKTARGWKGGRERSSMSTTPSIDHLMLYWCTYHHVNMSICYPHNVSAPLFQDPAPTRSCPTAPYTTNPRFFPSAPTSIAAVALLL